MSPNLETQLRGVFIPIITPFDERGDIDFAGLEANSKALAADCEGGDFVFLAAGSTGEVFSLTLEEHEAVVATVVGAAAGRFPVIAGTSATATRGAMRAAKAAQQAGAAAVLVVPPYYTIPNEEGAYRHYREIAEHVDVGIIVYNNPGVTGAWIGPSLMARLAAVDNIIASKENTPFILNYHRMWQEIDPRELVVLCGLGEPMYAFVGLYGCPAMFSGRLGNVAPQISHRFYKAVQHDDMAEVQKLLSDLSPYFRFFDRVEKRHPPSIKAWWGRGGSMMHSVIKAAVDIVGLKGGCVRSPLVELTLEEKQELRRIMAGIQHFHIGLE